MLKKKNQQILKYKLKSLIFLKYEYKNKILKSIIQNNNICSKYRLFAHIKIQKKKNIISKKICLISGRHRGVNTRLKLSRHNMNYFAKIGVLQNYTINSW